MAKVEERIETLIKDTIENIGYDLYDVEYAKEGPNYYLRIFIDNKNGIDLNDCEKVSNAINEMLDESDIIKEQYYLEASPFFHISLVINNLNIKKSVLLLLYYDINK